MKHIQNVGRHFLVFAATLLALWGLLILSAMIPNEALRANMERSALSYRDADAYQFQDGGRWYAIADNYADAIWLNISWQMGEGNRLASTLDTRYYDGGEYGVNAGLYLSVTEGVEPNVDYTRYWHGSAAIIRFMHLFADVESIKIIGFCLVLLLAAVVAALLGRRGHWDIAALFLLSLMAVQIWNVRLSMEYQPVFAIAFLLCALCLLVERRGDGWLTMLFVAGGAAVAFFDFLTVETVTLLLPLILVTAVRAKEGRLGGFRESLRLLIGCFICWGAAYGGAFLVKWLAAGVVTGENALAIALGFAAERVGGAVDPSIAALPTSIFSAIAANLTVLFGGIDRVQVGRALLGVGGFAVVMLSVWYLFREKEGNRAAAALLLILGAVVPLRYLILNNHSYIHAFFTYRALGSTVLAMLLALRLSIRLPVGRGVRR